ncbi:hypothetical protein STA3757_40500 [Stanieria sp. NIES-3757]|nr:hypothetical protein STA3757_40500 [Stanieria sp. NIES-3757]
MNPEELIRRYAPHQLKLIEHYNYFLKDELQKKR